MTKLSDITGPSGVGIIGKVVDQTANTGSAVIPSGNTAQRDVAPSEGYLRYNTDVSSFEGYFSTGWLELNSDLAAITKSFVPNETYKISWTGEITTSPIVSVLREAPVVSGSSSNNWDISSYQNYYSFLGEVGDQDITLVGYPGINDAVDEDSINIDNTGANDIRGVHIVDSGTKMYILDDTKTVYQFTLETPYIPSSANLIQTFLIPEPNDIWEVKMRPDGTSVYFIDLSAASVLQYDLSVPYDITTATSSNTHSVDANPYAMAFSSNGSLMFVSDDDAIDEYSLTSPWEIGTASGPNKTYTPYGSGTVYGLDFARGGRCMLMGFSNEAIHQINLSTAYDLNTAFNSNVWYTTGSIFEGMCVDDDTPESWYTTQNGFLNETIQKRTLPDSTTLYYDMANSTPYEGKAIAGSNNEYGVLQTDGTLSQTVNLTSGDVLAANTWNTVELEINSNNQVSYTNLAAAPSEEPNFSNTSIKRTDSLPPSLWDGNDDWRGIWFSEDGTKFYAINQSTSSIYQANLDIPWDPSSDANTTISHSVVRAGSDHLVFDKDGTFFVTTNTRGTSNTVYLGFFKLTTPWDLSTANTQITDKYIHTSGAGGGMTMFTMSSDNSKVYFCYYTGTDYRLAQADFHSDYDPETQTTLTSNKQDIRTFSPLYEFAFASDDGLRLYCFDDSGYDIYSTTTPNDFSANNLIEFGTWTGTLYCKGAYYRENKVEIRNYQPSTSTIPELRVYNISNAQYPPDNTWAVAITKYPTYTNFWSDINSFTINENLPLGEIYYAISNDERQSWDVIDNTGGTRQIARNNLGTWQYNSANTYASTTWTNATENSERQALLDAIQLEALNKMNKVQIEAVSDANNYVSAEWLDFAVIMNNGTHPDNDVLSPTFTSVVINHDTDSRYIPAELATDYSFTQVSNTEIAFTSFATQNLKIRVK